MRIKDFKKIVWDFYSMEGRSSLPWRPPLLELTRSNILSPYHVLVSEIMLQQTQVDRVIPKFENWMNQFPTAKTLAHADLSTVLKAWQGLGYNRRGLNLKRAAEVITEKHLGSIPMNREQLKELPGVGEYTSGAVLAFAFNKPVVFIETNIRSVFLYHFFSGHGEIHDSEITPLIESTLDHDRPRDWYYALMDYGSHIKKIHGNPNKKSKHYTKQSSFKGSNRELRSKLLKYILEKGPVTERAISKSISSEVWSVKDNLTSLVEEGFLVKKKNTYTIS